MIPLRSRHRFMLFIMSVLAALCLGAVPARASITADFNGDGVIDVVDIQHVPDEQIIVRVSGAPPQVLHVRGRILNIVATDFNHDGRLDITALSEHRGILVWLNGRRGRFKAAPRRVYPRVLRWSRRAGTAGRSNGGGRDNVQAASDQGQDAVTGRLGFGRCPVPPISHRVVDAPNAARSAEFSPAHSPRAPPFIIS
jgi:hypothetical protein